jgi:hypothetical protein
MHPVTAPTPLISPDAVAASLRVSLQLPLLAEGSSLQWRHRTSFHCRLTEEGVDAGSSLPGRRPGEFTRAGAACPPPDPWAGGTGIGLGVGRTVGCRPLHCGQGLMQSLLPGYDPVAAPAGRGMSNRGNNPRNVRTAGAAGVRTQPRAGGGEGRSPGTIFDKSRNNPMQQENRRCGGGADASAGGPRRRRLAGRAFRQIAQQCHAT